MISKFLLSPFAANWLSLSVMTHAVGGGSAYYYFVQREQAPIVAELDLSMTPLVPTVPNAGGGTGKISEAWIAPKKKSQKAPAPTVSEMVQTKEEVVKEEVAGPCTGPCSETGVGAGGGGTGESEGQYIPAELATLKPRWLRNFITSSDYPLMAKQEGKDGRVVLTVLIDAEGRVRDARLLQGSYEVFNEVALRKVRQAVFSPAYNDKHKPVSCKVTLPIRFELK